MSVNKNTCYAEIFDGLGSEVWTGLSGMAPTIQSQHILAVSLPTLAALLLTYFWYKKRHSQHNRGDPGGGRSLQESDENVLSGEYSGKFAERKVLIAIRKAARKLETVSPIPEDVELEEKEGEEMSKKTNVGREGDEKARPSTDYSHCNGHVEISKVAEKDEESARKLECLEKCAAFAEGLLKNAVDIVIKETQILQQKEEIPEAREEVAKLKEAVQVQEAEVVECKEVTGLQAEIPIVESSKKEVAKSEEVLESKDVLKSRNVQNNKANKKDEAGVGMKNIVKKGKKKADKKENNIKEMATAAKMNSKEDKRGMKSVAKEPPIKKVVDDVKRGETLVKKTRRSLKKWKKPHFAVDDNDVNSSICSSDKSFEMTTGNQTKMGEMKTFKGAGKSQRNKNDAFSPICDKRHDERDSANHSPVDTIDSHSTHLCDARSEGSSDSGNGCSDSLASPSSLTPQNGSIARKDNTDCIVVYQFLIPQEHVGKLIGKLGSFVLYIKDRSNCKVYVKSHATSVNMKMVAIEGLQSEIDIALEIIRNRFPEEDFPDITMEEVPMFPIPTQADLRPEIFQLHLVEGIHNEVIISSLVSATHMFLQVPTHPTYPMLSYLNEVMNCTYNDATNVIPPVLTPLKDVIVAAPSFGGWYRAQIVAIGENEMCDIRFLDYGGYASIDVSALRPIRADMLGIPFQAMEVLLAKIAPTDDAFSEEATAYVHSLIFGKVCSVAINGYTPDGIPLLTLLSYCENALVSVNECLVEQGYAVYVPHDWVYIDENPVANEFLFIGPSYYWDQIEETEELEEKVVKKTQNGSGKEEVRVYEVAAEVVPKDAALPDFKFGDSLNKEIVEGDGEEEEEEEGLADEAKSVFLKKVEDRSSESPAKSDVASMDGSSTDEELKHLYDKDVLSVDTYMQETAFEEKSIFNEIFI